MTSILQSIKKLLGIAAEYTAFDTDIIIGINSAIMALTQAGIGPADGFAIQGSSEVWTDFVGDSKMLEGAKTYVYLKTKMGFDPPSSSFVMDAMNRQAAELEWRLNVQAEKLAETTPTS